MDWQLQIMICMSVVLKPKLLVLNTQYFSVVTLPSSSENASITILDAQSFMETSLPADELSNALSLEILAHFFIEI